MRLSRDSQILYGTYLTVIRWIILLRYHGVIKPSKFINSHNYLLKVWAYFKLQNPISIAMKFFFKTLLSRVSYQTCEASRCKKILCLHCAQCKAIEHQLTRYGQRPHITSKTDFAFDCWLTVARDNIFSALNSAYLKIAMEPMPFFWVDIQCAQYSCLS